MVFRTRNEEDAKFRNWLDGYLRPEGCAIVWSVDLSISVAVVVTTTWSDDDNGVRSAFSTLREQGNSNTNVKKGD